MSRFSFLILLYLAISCTPKDTFTSKAYHNLTAKYNAYFLAREQMKEVENDIFRNRKEDYNKVLQVFPPIDTNSLKQYDDKMKDCIDKAALIPNRHDNSNWLDLAYVVVGKARFYLRDYEQAQIAFRYVNGKGKDEDAKDEALIELMETFMQLEKMRDARTVMGYLSKREEAMTETNAELYNLAKANYYRKQDDYKRAGKYLVLAKENMKRGERRGRVYFILGQIYQKLGVDDKSYSNYKQVLRNNPNYDLTFYSKLYMAQVSNLGKNKNKIKRTFKRMLKDEKNKDYQDKIYYEMALFELKKDNVDGIKDKKKPEKIKEKGAIAYLNESVKISKNDLQKAYSYLKLGEIYYNRKKNFELSKVYYDSVVAYYPKKEPEYKDYKRRQKILTEFVKHLTSYRLEDSLQRLAKMPKDELETYLDSVLYAQEYAKLKAEEEARKLAEKQKELDAKKAASSIPKDKKKDIFYFDNPTLVDKGKREFKKIWNSRPLEDDWRRSQKEGGFNVTGNDSTNNNVEEEPEIEILAKEAADEKKEELKKKIPYDANMLKTSRKKLEVASYYLGKIYAQKLEEPENAIDQFEELLENFPKTEFEPEVLYFLWLLSTDLKDQTKADMYEKQLKSKFPKSVYAKLIDDPDYLKKLQENERIVKKEYGKAYKLYEIEKYAAAEQALNQIVAKYPETASLDRLMYLKALIAGRLRGKQALIEALESFVNSFGDSDLLTEASELLNRAK